MRKRILSILLTLCMVLCLLPTAVLAADEVSAKVNGIAVPAAGGSITGEGISGSVVFDASAKTLTLENATISVTTENIAIEIRSGIDTLILKGKNEIKWADESDKKTNIYAISASSSSFLIKGNSREDSLTVTLPGTTGGYKYAYAISMGKCEIRNCSVDITVIGGMQNFGDSVAIRVSDLKVKNAALDLIVGKDRQGNVQKAKQGACVFATGRISIENSYVNAGIYSSLDAQHAYYYAALQGQGGITCTDSVVYAESDVLQAGRTICLDGGDTTFSVKNSIFKAKSNQYAFSGYNYAKPTFENSLVELESKDIVMRGPTFGTISGFTKITATDKNGNVATYRPGDDLSTLSTDSRKVVIESQIHSHCVCGGKIASEGHTVHYPLMWTPWTKTDSLPTAAGNYYLTGNVLLKSNSDYFMPDGVQICLNGYAIRGVGGQGNLFFGKVLAQVAFLAGYDDRNILKGETHGMAQMGGPVISTFGCGEVFSPALVPGTANVLIAMEKAEALRPGFLDLLEPGGTALMADTRYHRQRELGTICRQQIGVETIQIGS